MENLNRKIKKLRLCIAMVIAIISCRNGTKTDSNIDSIQQATDTAKSITINSGTHCFAYTNNNDSVILSLTIKDNSVTGRLLYSLYEKDKNTGTIKGQFYGDTLLADYTFLSEGRRSVRQIIFLRKGNIFQEGIGSMKVERGRFVFTDISQVLFTGNTVLSPVNCNNFNKK